MFTFRVTARARFRSCSAPYQKSLRYLPPVLATFPFIEYGPMQLYLDEGYAYVAMDTPGMGRSEGV
jgi:predicted acyl esterase